MAHATAARFAADAAGDMAALHGLILADWQIKAILYICLADPETKGCEDELTA